jgi:hypothetical protein
MDMTAAHQEHITTQETCVDSKVTESLQSSIKNMRIQQAVMSATSGVTLWRQNVFVLVSYISRDSTAMLLEQGATGCIDAWDEQNISKIGYLRNVDSDAHAWKSNNVK